MKLELAIAIIGVAATIGGTVVGYLLGLRRFRFERLWERKFDTYEKIFDALNDFAEEMDLFWEEERRGNTIDEGRKEKVRELVRNAHTIINKHSRIGSFVLSDGSEDNLKNLNRALKRASDSRDWSTFLSERGDAIYGAIDALKKSARSDLNA